MLDLDFFFFVYSVSVYFILSQILDVGGSYILFS